MVQQRLNREGCPLAVHLGGGKTYHALSVDSDHSLVCIMLGMVAGTTKATMARTILVLPLKQKTAVAVHKGAMTKKLKSD